MSKPVAESGTEPAAAPDSGAKRPRPPGAKPQGGVLQRAASTRLEMYRGLGGFGTLGIEIVVSMLIGIFGGRWLDGRFGTEPWWMLGGFAFGIALSVSAVLRALKAMRREAAKEEREQGNPAPVYESDADRERRIEEGRKQSHVARTDSAKEGE